MTDRQAFSSFTHPLGPTALSDLRAAVRGRVITPGDAGYDQARTVFYGGIDRRPAVIVRVADAGDVSRVVSLARQTGLEVAIRSGGHSNAGHSVSDGGIVLDLSDMRALHINAERRTAWAETGLTAGEYTAAAGAHGLATRFGDTGSVGIGGLTLGGGVAAARRMLDQGSGVILMATSGSWVGATPLMGSTPPADAAMEAFIRSLAAELGPHGICVLRLWPAGVPETLSPEKIASVNSTMMMDAAGLKNLFGRLAEMAMLGRASGLTQVADVAAGMSRWQPGSGVYNLRLPDACNKLWSRISFSRSRTRCERIS